MSQIKFVLDFLNDLAHNNHKDWMDANRTRYQEARTIFIHLVEELLEGIQQFDDSLVGLEAKKSIFRINRDIRFSKDKQPYKTNFGADLSPYGKKSPFAGYYIHLEPGKSILAGGCYHPEPKVLKKIREEIDYNGSDFTEILTAPAFLKGFGGLWEEKLSRPPKGYDKENEHIELIKHKSFIAMKGLKDAEVTDKDFVQQALKSYKNLHPFMKFLNTPIQELAEG